MATCAAGSGQQQQSSKDALLQARRLHEAGDIRGALAVISAALAADQDNTKLLSRVARPEHIFGEHVAAIDDFTKAIQVGASLSARESISYGRLLIDAGCLDAGIEAMLSGSTTCKPEDRTRHLSACALAMAKAGREKEALQQMLEADSLGQLGILQIGLLAKLHEKIGDAAAAAATYDRVFSLNPFHAAGKWKQKEVHLKSGAVKGCSIHETRALQLCSTNSFADRISTGDAPHTDHVTEALADDAKNDKESLIISMSSSLRCMAFLVRAAAKRALGDLKGAVADLHQANKIKPLTGTLQGLHKQYITALCEAQPPTELMDVNAVIKRASAILSQQDAAAAAAALDAVAQLNANVPADLHQWAAVKAECGHYKVALHDLQSFMAENTPIPRADILHVRSICNVGLGKLPAAIKKLNAALPATEASTNKAEILYKRGQYQQKLGNLPAALSDLQAALTAATAETLTDQAYMLCSRSRCYWALDDWPAALQDLDEALRLRPEDVNMLCLRGSVKRAYDDLEGALEDASTAVQLAPDLCQTWWLQAMVYNELCMHDEALSSINKADTLKPDNQGILEDRGKCRLNVGDFAGAVSDFERAAQLGMLDDEALEALDYGRCMCDAAMQLGLEHQHLFT